MVSGVTVTKLVVITVSWIFLSDRCLFDTVAYLGTILNHHDEDPLPFLNGGIAVSLFLYCRRSNNFFSSLNGQFESVLPCIFLSCDVKPQPWDTEVHSSHTQDGFWLSGRSSRSSQAYTLAAVVRTPCQELL